MNAKFLFYLVEFFTQYTDKIPFLNVVESWTYLLASWEKIANIFR